MKLNTMQFFLKLVLLSNFLMVPAISFAGTSQILPTYQNLSESNKEYWYKLLHAEFFKGMSKFDGEKFFLSPHGKESPSLELTATIEAFKDEKKLVGWFNYPAQCVFRGRFEFLKSIGYLEGIKEIDCPMYNEWKKGLNAASATIVFSSSYPNNPSSLFGHTLIRLNQRPSENKSDLLDYAISFSAIPESDDLGIVFAYKGMFGGYKGLIEVTKYYTKVMDYNNSESRDLLEYDLKMSEDELNRLIAHTWEIYQTTYADYYFFDENCSSVLADILAVALFPREHINDHSRWYYLPSELVRVLEAQKDLVNNFKFRPSLKKQLEKRLEHLSLEQRKKLDELISKVDIPVDFSDVDVLDTLISSLDYKRYRTKNNLSEKEKTLFRKSLIRRSAIKVDSHEYTDYQVTNRPELSHQSKYWESFLRTENSHSLIGLNYKTGYHNLMDRDLGFDPFSQFDFLTASIVYDKKINRLSYEQLNFVHLTSIHPFKFYDPQFSWNASVLADRYYQNNCDLCHKLDLRATGGLSGSLSSADRINLFAGAFFEGTEHAKRGFRTGPSLEFSYLINFFDKVKLGIFTEERFSALFKLKNDYQNISNIKLNYFPTTNENVGVEYKQLSKYGSFESDTKILSVIYGQHF